MRTLPGEVGEPYRSFLAPASRYKVLYGGRGAGKSWAVARTLLAMGAVQPLRILCAREIQRSVRDSVHRLLSDQIKPMHLDQHYTVQREAITHRNGTQFLFAGLRHNVSGLRSFEGVDICWVEEGQSVSAHSWHILIPTIRKPGSEIWVTFNPELEEDATWQRLVATPPTNARVLKVTWRDNKNMPEVLEQERLDLLARDPAAHAHVWEGECREAREGAIYAEELARAREEGRLTSVPYEPTAPVHTFWDLGWADGACVWMAQAVGLEFRVIDFLSGSQKPMDWFVRELNKRDYVWGEDWLPHDGESQLLAAAGRTIAGQMRELGRQVRIAPKVGVADGINAVRTVLGRCWFDQVKCADGLNSLRHYRYAVDEAGRLEGRPLHDWASHAADAFRYLAVSLEAERPRPAVTRREYGVGGWMR